MNMVLRGRESHARRTFIEITPELRRLLEGLIESAIDALDQIDGDPDLEDSDDDQGGQCDDEGFDGGDREPCLGWPEHGVSVHHAHEDLEEVCEDEGGQCDDEGHDSDQEPDLGWNEAGGHGGTWVSMSGAEG